MKRRRFLTGSATGALTIGLTGCSALKFNTAEVSWETQSKDFKTKISKPQGTMLMSEIGKSGIKVSKFGFGSHVTSEIVKFEKEREWMVREAYDLGINLFDVYEKEFGLYQYEPMGRYLSPIINDVVISISLDPFDGRSPGEQLERDLRLFGRDYIDLVRIHAYGPERSEPGIEHKWEWWEDLFRFKEQGKIRAIGVPIHFVKDVYPLIDTYPLDFVIFPYNFYHNWTWYPIKTDNFDPLIPELQKRDIGVVSMKPFAGDGLVEPFKRLMAQYDESGEVNYAKACLRYIVNSGLNIDTTLGGMYNPYQVYENVDAYFNPEMSDEERKVLKKIRRKAKVVAKYYLPDHYQFLEEWVPDSCDDSDLFGAV